MSRRYFLFAALVTITASSGVSATDAFPSKPIRLIVPSTPGTGTDSIARLLSAKLKDGAGWTVVVENRPCASGTLALGETARAKPDGHEWVIGLSTNVALAPSLMKLTFDPMKDLTPVAYLVRRAHGRAEHRARSGKTRDEFAALRNGGRVVARDGATDGVDEQRLGRGE